MRHFLIARPLVAPVLAYLISVDGDEWLQRDRHERIGWHYRYLDRKKRRSDAIVMPGHARHVGCGGAAPIFILRSMVKDEEISLLFLRFGKPRSGRPCMTRAYQTLINGRSTNFGLLETKLSLSGRVIPYHFHMAQPLLS